MFPMCSCADESSCMFLYRKPRAGPWVDSVLRAPAVGCTEAAADGWLRRYAEAFEAATGTAAAPAMAGAAAEQGASAATPAIEKVSAGLLPVIEQLTCRLLRCNLAPLLPKCPACQGT